MTNEQTFIIDHLLGDLVQLIIHNRGVDMRQALDILYTSPLYDQINDIETGLYLQSADYIYELM